MYLFAGAVKIYGGEFLLVFYELFKEEGDV
jgi:hypothetical protein